MTWADGVYTAWSLAVVVALILWWLSATGRTLGGVRVARLGALVRWLTDRAVLRVAVVLVWMWVGWHLFAR